MPLALSTQQQEGKTVSRLARSNLIDLEIYLKAETEKAILVTYGEGQPQVWLPKSQVEVERRPGAMNRQTIWITLPEILAMEKELI